MRLATILGEGRRRPRSCATSASCRSIRTSRLESMRAIARVARRLCGGVRELVDRAPAEAPGGAGASVTSVRPCPDPGAIYTVGLNYRRARAGAAAARPARR